MCVGDIMDYMRECSSPTLLSILGIIKNILSLIQIIIPVFLIVFATIEFVKLIKDPERKGGIKEIINKFLAAAIVFFIPWIMNVVINLLGFSTNLSTCWINADEFRLGNTTYIPLSELDQKTIFSNVTDYEKGKGNSACGEKIARLAVELAGTASPEHFIKSPSGQNYCAFNKSNDPRLSKYNQVHDSRISCNHAYASCTQAAATIIDAAADPEINWMGPRAQTYYLEHSDKWELVVRNPNQSWIDVLQPGDVGEVMWDSSTGHSWIYVGNEIARERFSKTDGYIYDGGYSSCKNPHINANSGLVGKDSKVQYFRFVGDCSEADEKNVKDGYGGPAAYAC